MSIKYFKSCDVPFMLDPDFSKIFMFIGDQWVEIADSNIKTTVRFNSTEITKKEAMALTRSNQNY